MPGVRAYTELPFNDSIWKSVDRNAKAVKLEKTVVGQETLDGHPCIKTEIVIIEPDHPSENAVVWYASDLQQFPIQIEQVVNGKTAMSFVLKSVQLQIPSNSLFEVPTNYSKCADANEIQSIGIQKNSANKR